MSFILQPWQLLLLILAGWINRQQQEIIEYLRTENQILRESHGRKRIKLDENQRRRLAAWMKQIARDLSDFLDGFLLGTRHFLIDRDTKYCEPFRFLLEQADVNLLRLPARSPSLNAHLERFLHSLKGECLDRMILFGDRSLRKTAGQFLGHYHQERNHPGLGKRSIEAGEEISRTTSAHRTTG